jgi:hypothetical protein
MARKQGDWHERIWLALVVAATMLGGGPGLVHAARYAMNGRRAGCPPIGLKEVLLQCGIATGVPAP